MPAVRRFEVLNGLLSAQRRRRIDPAGVDEAIEAIDGLDAEIDPLPLAEVHRLAVEHRLSIHETSYLELARREGIGPAT